ncbi:hypothetical protein NLU13_1025 [Sarocladium strictum]|uniref:DOMON domain-containing protein n=1 Tax=Sarocladium strictum TaxID=5046 RepID=A0AA39GQ64_SARSR|nr:hypothetical protein NLU13_1025 [Sarocladium strictum]
MQLSNLLSAAMLAYVASGAALPDHGEDSSPSPSSSGSASAAAGSDAASPSGGAAAPATGADYQPAVSCRNNICYSAVVPSATVRSGSGPVWFQIYAPTTFSWVGMGTGSSMSDANMFLIYQDGNGNVTVSHRQATGHTMPTVPANDNVQITLLPGSGVQNNFMVANFRCDNCTTWKQSQSLNLTAAGTPMVGAWREGDALDSTDVEEAIGVHTGNVRMFSFDLSTAQKSTPGNPFVGQFAAPAELSVGGANNTNDASDDEGAAVGQFSFLPSGVVAAAIVTGLSLLL